MAGAQYNLSLVVALHDPEEREALLREAVGLWEQLTQDQPGHEPYRLQLALALAQLGHSYFSRGAPEAEDCLRRALGIGVPIWQENGVEDVRTALAWATGILATVLRRNGDAHGTVEVARMYQDVDPTPVEVAWAAVFIATAVTNGRRSGISPETLEEWTDEALGLLEGLVDRAPDDPRVHHELTEPEFGVFEGEERFQALLEAFGVER